MATTLTRFLAVATAVLVVASDSAADLVVNTGFEQASGGGVVPESWSCDKTVYSLDPSVKRSGEASLKYENSDPGRYRLAAQKVPLEPGRKYHFSAWVKTDQIAGPESGATLCLEWQDKNGKWLGGSYPEGIKGTSDWSRVEGIVRIPKEAGPVNLSCYVRNGMTGRAWFDDVQIERVVDPPMRTALLTPNYRGRITGQGPAEASVRVHLDLTDFDAAREDLRLAWLLQAADGTRIVDRTGLAPSSEDGIPADLSISLPSLAPGRYDLAIHLLDSTQKILQETHHSLHRVPDDFKPLCAIDAHGRLLVEGKPFLPLGMYWSSINEEELKIYADSKFNCLMPYGSPTEEQMDLAQRYGLKVIYSVKDFYAGSGYAPGFIKTEADEKPNILDRVERFGNHPALLAWYLNDELPQTFLPQLEAHQQWVAEADPNHPTWVVLYQFREVGAYVNTFDVIGTDPYPIGRAPTSEVALWTAETRRQVEGARPVWQVPQLHNWINYRKDDGKSDSYHTPTYDEMRSMAWQCLCEGATGLVFYSWFDLKRNPDVPFDLQWAQLKQIVAEIDRFAPILLSVEERAAFDLKVHGGTPQKPEEVPSWLHYVVRRRNDKVYLFAVNDGDGAGQVCFGVSPAVEGKWQVHRARDLTNDRILMVLDDEFAGDFEPLSVHVYEITLAGE